MGRYTDCVCDHCGKKLTEQDDIVICPVCGAPQHRTCYQAHHACPHEAEHAAGYEWQFPTAGAGAKIACPHCGAQNDADAAACQLCGAPLRESASGFGEDRWAGGSEFAGNIYGRTPDFTVESVSSEELKCYYGKAAVRLLPKFNIILQQRFTPATWSIPALIFGPFYLLYRKVKKPAIFLLLILLALHVPNFLYGIEYFKAFLAPQMLGITIAYSESTLLLLTRLANFAGGLRVALHFYCGFRANQFLLGTAIDDIRDMQEKYTAEERRSGEYRLALSYRGRPSAARAILCVFAVLILTYMATYIAILPYLSV